MTLDGFSHTSLISLFVARRTKFFSLGEESLNLGLWHSLFLVGHSLTRISMMGGCLLVGDHLAW